MSEISRVSRSHDACRANYDHLSRWYDLLEGGWENHARHLGLNALHITADDHVLEIGCGTGHSFVEISRKASAVGLDLSIGMLSQTGMRLQKSHLAVTLVQGDALCLPFQANSFSAVFMAFTLELMDTPEISSVIGEIYRVLQPGGRLGVVSLSKLGGIGAMKAVYEWAHAHYPVSVDCRPIYARQCLEEAGFTVMEHNLISQTGLGIEVVIVRSDETMTIMQ